MIDQGLTEPDPTGYNRQDIEGLFKQGRIGMILTGPWLRGQIKTEARSSTMASPRFRPGRERPLMV